jgi:hypothetical protein
MRQLIAMNAAKSKKKCSENAGIVSGLPDLPSAARLVDGCGDKKTPLAAAVAAPGVRQ